MKSYRRRKAVTGCPNNLDFIIYATVLLHVCKWIPCCLSLKYILLSSLKILLHFKVSKSRTFLSCVQLASATLRKIMRHLQKM